MFWSPKRYPKLKTSSNGSICVGQIGQQIQTRRKTRGHASWQSVCISMDGDHVPSLHEKEGQRQLPVAENRFHPTGSTACSNATMEGQIKVNFVNSILFEI